jgi:hypothetical protein
MRSPTTSGFCAEVVGVITASGFQHATFPFTRPTRGKPSANASLRHPTRLGTYQTYPHPSTAYHRTMLRAFARFAFRLHAIGRMRDSLSLYVDSVTAHEVAVHPVSRAQRHVTTGVLAPKYQALCKSRDLAQACRLAHYRSPHIRDFVGVPGPLAAFL